MAKMFGLPGADDESNRRFAANMMKYQGWKSVRYVGKGVFDVDYHFEGRVGQDFAFPIMPDSDFIIPFITIRRRNDGSVMVIAPSFTGATGPFGARAKMMGLPDKSDGPKSRAEGRFTITTDGEILTNNSEDGPAAHAAGRQVHWDVGPGSTKIPEMLVRLTADPTCGHSSGRGMFGLVFEGNSLGQTSSYRRAADRRARSRSRSPRRRCRRSNCSSRRPMRCIMSWSRMPGSMATCGAGPCPTSAWPIAIRSRFAAGSPKPIRQ